MAGASTSAQRQSTLPTRNLKARPPLKASAPATAATNATQQSAPANPSHLPRRLGLRAAGVAVIVIAGTILGSQLKTRQQAQERSQKQQFVELDGSDTDRVKQPVTKPPQEAPPVPPRTPVTSSADIQKQIAYLEERRGVLMTQKFNLENKLEVVREKKRKEEEMESRRAPRTQDR